QYSFKHSKSLPSGQNLLRVERIALQQASQEKGVQFSISGANVNVASGGNGSQGPMIQLLGGYSANDPGIKLNLCIPPVSVISYC
ncbi:uncharacterized protein BDR25DRAFT_230158, partial [Lindgomyces ingoldianus]